MFPRSFSVLSRRERQVMDALYRLQEATVAELVEEIPEEVTYSAVRAVLRTLREKNQVDFTEKGPRYIYRPAIPRDQARSRALEHVVRTFFDGSPEAAAVALIEMADLELTEQQLDEIEDRISQARKEGR